MEHPRDASGQQLSQAPASLIQLAMRVTDLP